MSQIARDIAFMAMSEMFGFEEQIMFDCSGGEGALRHKLQLL